MRNGSCLKLDKTHLSFEEIVHIFRVKILGVSLHIEGTVEIVWRLKEMEKSGSS